VSHLALAVTGNRDSNYFKDTTIRRNRKLGTKYISYVRCRQHCVLGNLHPAPDISGQLCQVHALQCHPGNRACPSWFLLAKPAELAEMTLAKTSVAGSPRLRKISPSLQRRHARSKDSPMDLPATASGILRFPPNRLVQLRAAPLAARLRKLPLPPGSSRALEGARCDCDWAGPAAEVWGG